MHYPFVHKIKPGAYTDITGDILQANEAGSGNKMVLIFSDLQEEAVPALSVTFPCNWMATW
jgi:hypothetical protein